MIPAQAEIFVYTQPVDMRKQINGLITLLVDSFNQKPQQGDLFVFTNKQRKKLKIRERLVNSTISPNLIKCLFSVLDLECYKVITLHNRQQSYSVVIQ